MRKLIVKVDTCPSELELVARNSTTVTKQKQNKNKTFTHDLLFSFVFPM